MSGTQLKTDENDDLTLDDSEEEAAADSNELPPFYGGIPRKGKNGSTGKQRKQSHRQGRPSQCPSA